MEVFVAVVATLTFLAVLALARMSAQAEAEACCCPYSCAVHDPDAIIVSEEA